MIREIVKKVSVGATIAQASVMSALAQGPRDFIPADPTGNGELINWVQAVLNLAIALAGLVAVGYLVYSGIQYIMSNGDDGKVDQATKGITYAIIGLIICFIAVLIVNFVINRVLGVA